MTTAFGRHSDSQQGIHAAVLDTVPGPLMVLAGDFSVLYVNPAAEQFFGKSSKFLLGRPLPDLVLPGSSLLAVANLAYEQGTSIHEHLIEVGVPRVGKTLIDLFTAPLNDGSGRMVLALYERSVALRMTNQMGHRSAARSVTGVAALLSHEIRNPLSGIRGAAQLLEEGANDQDRELTQLIQDEADRIAGLINRVDLFTEEWPIEREPINIHEVLSYVRGAAKAGFANDINFVERYDPSLPFVAGDRDRLIQVFLNLVKNAAEAIGKEGMIYLETNYQHGWSLPIPGNTSGQRIQLPLEVLISDNGPGISEDLKETMFEPFVTTKRTGTGLGLPLVAKIVGDHGGIIECESVGELTVFRVRLPIGS